MSDPETPEFGLLTTIIRKYKTIALMIFTALSTLLVQNGWGIITTKDKFIEIDKKIDQLADSVRVARLRITSVELDVDTIREQLTFIIEINCANLFGNNTRNRDLILINRRCTQYLGEK